MSACPCDQPVDPQVVRNPPGLPAIAYRVDDFSGFRRALLAPLAGEVALHGWRPAPGDLGLQILEWWAYLGDILTFYNERIANESYLRTAEQAASVAGLVALLGYRPRPAIGAVGQVAAIRTAARPAEPVVIPAGMQLANTATPGVDVQTFEAAAASFAGASDVPIGLPPGPALLAPQASATDPALVGSVLLAGTVAGLKAGDELVALPRAWWSVPAPSQLDWAKLSVVSATPEADPSGAINTRVMLDLVAPDGAGAWLAVAAAADVRLVSFTQSAGLWTQANESGAAGVHPAGAGASALTIELAAVVSAISPGDVLLLDGAGGAAPALVTGTQAAFATVPFPSSTTAFVSVHLPGIPVAHSQLTVQTPDPSGAAATFGGTASAGVNVRFGVRDAGTLLGTPPATLTALPALGLTVTVAPGFALPAGGAPAFVEDANGAGIPVWATSAGAAHVTLTATADVPATPATFALTAPLRLLADLIGVSRGSTVAAESLGTGDASVAGQTFTLARSPLTYLSQGADVASTLQIAVDGIYWTEAPTFYGEPPDATVFVVTQLPGATSQVRFGDGLNGARLPSGGQVVATYRYGAGLASPPAGRLTTILQPQANLAAVHNPWAVWGGDDAQAPADVRRDAPASVLTFGRAISADDYETVAAQAAGVARARAYWTWDAPSQRTLVKVYVGDDAAAVAAASRALAGAEDPNRPVVARPATAIGVTVACTLLISADRVPAGVLAAATAALGDVDGGFFSACAVGIGNPLYVSRLEAALLVDGVLAVHGLSVVTAGGTEILGSQPVGWADPGEGGFYTLTAFTPTAQVSDV